MVVADGEHAFIAHPNLFVFVLKLTVGSFWQYIFSNISESDRSRRFSWVGRVVEICGPQPPY